MEEGVAGVRLEDGRERSKRVNLGSKGGWCVERRVMVKKKKRVPWRRVVPRIGSVVEREARVGS